MLATRCGDRCAPTGADGVTAPAVGVALAGSNTMAAAIAPSVPAGTCPTTAATASTAAALSQGRSCG